MKPLSDAGLLYLAARIAVRLEAWCPPGGESAWRAAVEAIVAAGNGRGPTRAEAQQLATALLNHGARGTYSDAPEHLSRARNQAASAVSCGLEASAEPLRKHRWKLVRDAGKHMASVYALQAHAGRMPIELALTRPWAAVRADIPVVAGIAGPVSLAKLRELAPAWPGGEPAWARPSG